jgi:hypothetical protein
MVGYIVRKLLVIMIMVLPLVSYSGCKKQAKCGCGKDVLFSLSDEPMEYSSLIYNTGGTNAYFQSGVDTYYFCNPGEMFPVYSTLKKGDQLLISGDVFWECNYLYSASNYSYQMYYKVYQIQVKELKAYLYGKK